MRKVGAAPGGMIPLGPNQVSRNQSYFACASTFSVMFYSLPEFVLSETLCVSLAEIVMICLNQIEENIVAILYKDSRVQLYNFVDRRTLLSVKISDERIRYMNFNAKHTKLLLFPWKSTSVQVLNLVDGQVEKVYIPGFTTINSYIYHPEFDFFVIIGSDSGLMSIDFNSTAALWHATSNPVYSMHLDPRNSTNMLVVTKKPTWLIMSFLPKFAVLSKSIRDDINCRCGLWIKLMPGHVITGDEDCGILYYWSAATGDIVDRVSVHEFGIVSMTEISDFTIAVVFKDGLVAVFDVVKKKLTKKMNNAHTNTIFACAFIPTDPTILATAGADKLVCMWRTPELVPFERYHLGRDYSIMDMCFSPGGTYIACTTAEGSLVIYSTQQRRMIFNETLHKGRVLGVSWCLTDNAVIATAGEDATAVLYNIEKRSIITRVTAKSAFRRIKWSPHSKTVAIASESGVLCVRRDGGAFKTVNGTGYPLFDVAWNPFNENIVAASDDSGNVIVFHLDTDTFEFGLEHNGKARPVVWSPVMEHILFSGGYDGRLIMWDTRTMKKIVAVEAHASHIYGIGIHKSHPFMLATVSRDETVRLWSIDKYFPMYKIRASLSNNKKFDIENLCPYEGSSALTKVLHRVIRDGVKVTFGPSDICHINDVVRLVKKRVSKMTSSAPRDQAALARSPAAKKNLLEAADLCLKAGDTKRYCELLFVAGEYDKAISFAPAVSYAFWQNLMLMKSEMLKESEKSAQMALIAGKPEIAIEKLVSLKEFDSAALIISTLRGKDYAPRTRSHRVTECALEEHPYCQDLIDDPYDFTVYKVASCEARNYLKAGKPFLAATSFLSIGDVLSAAWTLVHAGEIVWAYVVSASMKENNPIRDMFIQYCISNGAFDLVWSTIPKKRRLSLVPLLDFPDERSRENFYEKNDLLSPLYYGKEAVRASGSRKIDLLLLAGREHDAQKECVSLLKPMLSSSHWNFMEVSGIIDKFRNIKNPSAEIAAISHMCGVYKAMWRGYTDIISKLVSCVESSNLEWLAPRIKELKICALLSVSQKDPGAGRSYMEENSVSGYEALAGLEDGVDGGSTVKTQGSGVVPIDVDSIAQFSICSKTTIKGNAFLLEDDKTTMSEDEALMWFEVTPFSPLKTHQRLSPY